MDIGGMVPPVYHDLSFPLIIHSPDVSGSATTSSCWHEDLEWKLIYSGKTTALIESHYVTAEKDEIIFMNPYQMHSMPALEGNNRQYYLFMLDLDFFRKTGVSSLDLRKLFMQNRIQIHNHIRNPRLTEILRRIIHAYFSPVSYTKELLQGLLLEFFALLLQEEVSDAMGEEVGPERLRYYRAIEPALETVHMLYSQKISGEELARQCQMSVYYFSHIFKRVMGMTPGQYQTEYRLRIADILLKQSQMSVRAVAHAVGFEDEAYFSRCYKKHKGISPRESQNTQSITNTMGAPTQKDK